MDRLVPATASEMPIPARSGSGPLHATAYTLLALMVAGAAWVRFNDRIAASIPALAGPAEGVADRLADASRIKGLLEVPILAANATAQAVADMALPDSEAKLLTDALRRRQLRLIRMPLLDLSAAPAAQGRMVQVSAGGYTRTLQLSRTPVTVTLPVGPVGTVSFQTASTDGVGIGAMTLAGLARLPALPAGATLEIGVIAQ